MTKYSFYNQWANVEVRKPKPGQSLLKEKNPCDVTLRCNAECSAILNINSFGYVVQYKQNKIIMRENMQ